MSEAGGPPGGGPGGSPPLGLLARILPFSAVDGPGNRAVFFLQGCDFDCAYCHNPETRTPCSGCGACVPACPAGALSPSRGAPGDGALASSRDAPGEAAAGRGDPRGGAGGAPPSWDRGRCRDCGACAAACPLGSSPRPRLLSAEDALAEIERFRPFLRGITVSGGECSLQPAFLASLLEAAMARGLPGLVDTNGGRPLAAFPRLLQAAEGFMLDVKAWNPAEHLALTGADNGPVLGNLRLLAGSGRLFEVRTVVALRAGSSPGPAARPDDPAADPAWAFDLEETVRETAAVLRAARSRARYRLISYRPFGVRAAKAAALREPGEELVGRLAALARETGAAEVLVSQPLALLALSLPTCARLDLVFGERNVLSAGQSALVEVDLAGAAVELRLDRGGVTSVLKKLERLAEAESFRVVTAQSVAGVRGTSFCVWADSSSTYVCARNGAVRTIDAKGSNELELEAAHHAARLYVAKDGAVSVEAAGMLHHTDESVESAASRIGYAIDWTKVDR